MKIEALAAHDNSGELKVDALEDHECLIKVIACGICGSDLGVMALGIKYPMVPGHEVAGEIVEVGKAARRFKAGDRVGVGWQSGACLECRDCLRGKENFCDQHKALIIAAYGGFARHLKVDARFAFALPAGIEPKLAGPLMCAGSTVYTALRDAGMSSGQRIGVVGVGGLGHLAIQFASKLGNDVIAFTGSSDKAEFASRLGAKDSVIVPRGGKIPGEKRNLNIILVTSSEELDWASYIEQLDTGGTIVTVAFPKKPMAIPAFPMVVKGRRLMASRIGSRASINEMLTLAARWDVRPIVETFPLAQANEAVSRVRANKVRYRAVLEV
jgi:uncharacterized zinc-type alcohol dehydrogenase-like protein